VIGGCALIEGRGWDDALWSIPVVIIFTAVWVAVEAVWNLVRHRDPWRG
jgi:hypothetical protein